MHHAWHSAGTFDCQSRTGGPIGTMGFDSEPTVVSTLLLGCWTSSGSNSLLALLLISNSLLVLWPLKLLVVLKFLSTLEERLIIVERMCSAFFVEMAD
ncbi:hypothetical protein ISN44_As09g012210 [Arabidopsis suecica]|uniref:Uncharacterized protein n=1 Tax=Arabidopsis suecica TaxID=45249 RepID=A0A8T2AH88_ARASU|nr:hypothetical protein ISN44_As09g012210 [Arabidopsis suecica]